MDPTHFIASSTLPERPSDTSAQSFYETHSFDPFRRMRNVLVRIRTHLRSQTAPPAHPKFAVRHPAE